MSTAGQTITGLSGLSGISAGQHLLAITAVPVAPPAGFASRMFVTLTTERLSVTEKPRKQAQQVVRQEVKQVTRKQTRQSAEPKLTIAQASIRTITPSVWITTQADEWWIRTNKETF